MDALTPATNSALFLVAGDSLDLEDFQRCPELLAWLEIYQDATSAHRCAQDFARTILHRLSCRISGLRHVMRVANEEFGREGDDIYCQARERLETLCQMVEALGAEIGAGNALAWLSGQEPALVALRLTTSCNATREVRR